MSESSNVSVNTKKVRAYLAKHPNSTRFQLETELQLLYRDWIDVQAKMKNELSVKRVGHDYYYSLKESTHTETVDGGANDKQVR